MTQLSGDTSIVDKIGAKWWRRWLTCRRCCCRAALSVQLWRHSRQSADDSAATWDSPSVFARFVDFCTDGLLKLSPGGDAGFRSSMPLSLCVCGTRAGDVAT